MAAPGSAASKGAPLQHSASAVHRVRSQSAAVPRRGQASEGRGAQHAEVTFAPHRSSTCDVHTCSAMGRCCSWREQQAQPVDHLGVAVVLVHNAWHGREPAPPSPDSLWARQIYHALWYRYTSLLVLLGYLALSLFERPAEAAGDQTAVVVAEALCLLAFAADLRLQWLYYGKDIFFRKLWSLAKAGLIPIFVLSLVLHAATGGAVLHFARPLRPVFLIERMRGVRRVAANMLVAVPKMLYVGFLMWMNIGFFGVIFFVFLGGTQGTPPSVPVALCAPSAPRPGVTCSTYNDGCRDYFSTLDNSIYQLFILSTTANFPDVMLPAYECNRWWGWLFVAFIIISIYLLFNLTLAVAFTAFSSVTQRKVVDQVAKSLAGYSMAYRELLELQRCRALRAAAAAGRPARRSLQPADAAAEAAAAIAADRAHAVGPGQAVRSAAQASPLWNTLSRKTWVAFYCRLKKGADAHIAGVLFDSLDPRGLGSASETQFQRLMMYFARIYVRLPPGGRARTPSGAVAGNPLAGSEPEADGKAGHGELRALVTTPEGLRERPSRKPSERSTAAPGRASPPPPAPPCECSAACCVAHLLSAVGTYVGSGVPIASAKAAAAPRCSRSWWAYCMFNAWATVFFDFMVLLNGIVIVAQLQLEPGSGALPPSFSTAVEAVQFFTLSVFLAEVVGKAGVLGPGEFWRMSSYHRTDVALAALSVMALVIQGSTAANSSQLASAITMVRMVRMLRGARVLPGFTITISSFMDAIPLLAQFVVVFASVLYSFSVIGMELYSGALTLDNPAVADSSYGKLEYRTLTFDSLPSAMMTLFHTSVVNNAPVVFDGLEAATGSKWPRVFFILYYTVTVLLVLNVVIAFFIESFSVQREKRETIAALVAEGALAPGSTPEEGRAAHAESTWTGLVEVPTAGSSTQLLPNGALRVLEGGSSGRPVAFEDLQQQPLLRQSYEWRLVIEASGLDIAGYRLWKRLHADDIYLTLYMDELRKQFPAVFSDDSVGRFRGEGGDAAGAPAPVRVNRRASM